MANDEEFPEIYQVPGDAQEIITDVEFPEDWESLDDAAHEQFLKQLGLTDSDFADEETELKNVPVVAIVGRPNVGKSTLVNRIIGRREAVVEDIPGVTRDRVRYDAEWNGIPFVVIDTGGWERDPQGLSVQVSAQAEAALTQSDVIVFVVDATVGVTNEDEFIMNVLRKAKVPIILVAN